MSEPPSNPKLTTPPPPHTSSATDPKQPPSTHKTQHLQNFIQEAIEATNPSLRHLASHSSLNSQLSTRTQGSDLRRFASPRSQIRPLSTAFEEQRHPGKPALSITRNTRHYDPLAKETGSLASCKKDGKVASVHGSAVYASDETTLVSDPRESSVVDYAAGSGEFRPYAVIEAPNTSQDEEVKSELEGGEEEETNYPGPLGLSVLITGIALSVFLISLDRTIITTVSSGG